MSSADELGELRGYQFRRRDEQPGSAFVNTASSGASFTASQALFVPAKPWSAPDPTPAEPHWVWTTSDGQEYDDVVITDIGPDTVSITHSRGVAHVAIATLPPEIQKQLNYDPAAAAAAAKEAKREADHPYYLLASLEEAKAAARELHRPLAWMCSNLKELDETNPSPNSGADLTQMALNDLKSQSVVIFLDGNGDLLQVPPVVLQQFFQFDDGPVPGGHHFYDLKIVFSDPDVKKALGRVSSTQMKATRDSAITNALEAIAAGKFAAPTPAGP